MQQEYEIDVRWTAFPLRTDVPEEGRPLTEVFSCQDDDVKQMTVRLKKVANSLGLPFGDRTMTYNSRLAQELGKWAEANGKGDEYHNAVFRAYLADGKNIGKIPVLLEVAESINLNGKDARKIIRDRAYKQAVDSDWRRSCELKVTAAPTFCINHQSLVGAQNYDTLELLLLSNQVKKRNPKEG